MQHKWSYLCYITQGNQGKYSLVGVVAFFSINFANVKTALTKAKVSAIYLFYVCGSYIPFQQCGM